MGWFSDALFGKRQRMNPNKINDMMSSYDQSVEEQMSRARDMMDPDSALNMQQKQMIRSEQADATAAQNQNLLSMAASQGLGSGQAAAQMMANSQTSRGQLGNQFSNLMLQQQQGGQNLFNMAMQGQKGIGERQANMYMEQVNAANARRQQNVGIVTGLVEAGLGAAGSIMSDVRVKENIELIGKSPKGVNIYEFDYKNKSHGDGRYRGVMAQEVPNAAFEGNNGYLHVDYSKVDVKFERIN